MCMTPTMSLTGTQPMSASRLSSPYCLSSESTNTHPSGTVTGSKSSMQRAPYSSSFSRYFSSIQMAPFFPLTVSPAVATTRLMSSSPVPLRR